MKFKVGDEVIVVNRGYRITGVGSIGVIVDTLEGSEVMIEFSILTGQHHKDYTWNIETKDITILTPLHKVLL